MIGSSESRIDGRAKTDGAQRYTADISYGGMLHAAVVRAAVPHGRIRAIRKGPGVDWSRIVFATAADIPGQKNVQMIAADMPYLASEEVLYVGEPVALVAAPTLAEAEAARRAVQVEIEPLPAILTLQELVERHQTTDPGLHELARWSLGKGDVEAGLAAADVVLDECYTTPHQEHAYLETNAMIAVPEAGGVLRVEGSLQCPYFVAPAVASMLGTDLSRVHVRAIPMGGAFGGKEDFPSMLGGHVALLAHLSGRPVRLVLGRAEDMACSTKRHPSWVRIRAGARKDGSLCAVEIDVVFDGGAYITMSPVVLSRGAIHAPGPYNWPASRVRAVAYRSNTPPNGAFRGFGVPQTIFAIESHMDELARACGLAPHTLRLKNRLLLGDLTATAQRLKESVGTEEVLQAALEDSGFEGKLAELGADRIQPGDKVARGVGLALFWHGAGFTGAGEARIAGRVALDLSTDRRAHIRMAATEMGQGAHTVLCQIVGQELGVPTDRVVVDPVDTHVVPDSGPTVASRTTMIVGEELATCARAARARLLQAIADLTGRRVEELDLRQGAVLAGKTLLDSFERLLARALAAEDSERWTFESQHRLAPDIRWDEATHTGDAYACYAWACTVVEVQVDLDTFEVQVPHVWMAVDLGRAINPTLAQGQVEGAVLQALGYALTEEVGVLPDGRLLRDRFQTYILPTFLDAPQIVTRLIEIPYSRGPGGAKGLGEMPLHGGAPAVANALQHALGVRLRDLPLLPEKIYQALRQGGSWPGAGSGRRSS